MVARLEALVSDGPLRERMSRAAVDELERPFSEDGMIEGLEALYSELLGPGTS
jgi:hypothetical protein